MFKNICTIMKLLFLVAISLGLATCSDGRRELTLHEPGEYKGTTDPLLAAGQHRELKNRFMKVQTDR